MKTILQVEDDPNDVYLLHHTMKRVGVENPVQFVKDGQQAIDYLQGAGKFADREKFPFPYLVLLDLKLPYVMGLEVLKWIRSQCGSALPVIMLTASAEEADIAAAYRLGANAFLVKPSEVRKLEDMAIAIKHFWLTHNTLPHESLPAPFGNEGRNGSIWKTGTLAWECTRRIAASPETTATEEQKYDTANEQNGGGSKSRRSSGSAQFSDQ